MPFHWDWVARPSCSHRKMGEPLSWALPSSWLKRNVAGNGGGRRPALGQEADLASHDFGLVALTAAAFRFVLAGPQTAFDIALTAFAQETLTDLRQPSEGDDAMPLRALLPG